MVEAPHVPHALRTGAVVCLRALARSLWGSVPQAPGQRNGAAMVPGAPKSLECGKGARRALTPRARRCCSNSSKGEGGQYTAWVLMLAVERHFQCCLSLASLPSGEAAAGSDSKTRAEPPLCNVDLPWEQPNGHHSSLLGVEG